jgi:lysophospholipase L1-like esterase
MKKITIIAALLLACMLYAMAAPTSVTLKVIDMSKGVVTNRIDNQNEVNIFTWLSDNLSAQNPRTPADWWYPMYNDAAVSSGNGLLVKTDSSWNWTLSLQVEPGTYQWCPHAKTLGWQPIKPLMFDYTADDGNNLVFTVSATGELSGNYELVIPDPSVLPTHDITVRVIDMTKGVLTDAPGTWAYDANIIAWLSGTLNDGGYWFYGLFGRENVEWESDPTNLVTFPRGELIKNDTAWIWQATFEGSEGIYEWNPMSILHGWQSLNNVVGDAHWEGENMQFNVSSTGVLSGMHTLVLNYPKPDSLLTRVACIGNSNTFGAGASNAGQYAWPVQLRAELGPEYATSNFGVSGATLMNIPEPWGAWTNNATGKYEEFKRYNSEVALIALGTNDSKDGIWTDINDFKSEYISFLDTVYKYSVSDVEIYMIIPIKSLANGFGINNTNITDGVIPAIRALSLEKGIQVIDWYDISKDWTNADIGDGVHPGDAGLGTMAEKVAEIMLTPKPVIAIEDSEHEIADDIDFVEYRWYKDDVLLTAASGKEYMANETGTYKLAVKLSANTDDIIVSNKITVSEVPQNLILASGTSVDISPAVIENTFNVSPNPVNDKIHIADSRNNIVYTLLDIRGTVVAKTKNKTINISHLKSGIYMLQAGGKTVKIIKK